jgi:hypothetical protein
MIALIPAVAEPPKLYGPHVFFIVLKTSNNHTCVPQNLRSLSGVLGNPNHPRPSEQDHISEALQYYNSLYNKLHQSTSVEVLHNISSQTRCFKLTNHKFSYYNHNSGVALVTLLHITKTRRSAQEPNILLIIAYRKYGHVAGFETHLLMRCTCNRGLTNPEYKSTPQDLTDEKGGDDSGMQAHGNQAEVPARIKVLLHKSY